MKQPRTVSKGLLKAKMLEIFREIEKSHQELIVTDNNVPVLKVVPLRRPEPPSQVFKDVRGNVKYFEDLTTPTTTEWSET